MVNDSLTRLQRVFRDVLENDSLELRSEHSSENLQDWDSFAHVKLIIGIEEEFDVRFSVDEVAETKDVGKLLQLIGRKSGEV
jgi:acyl carrier protein